MEPTIENGDFLIIDRSITRVDEFGIYVLEIGDERMIKRVQRHTDGALVLISDNVAYAAETVPADRAASITIVGRVRWRGGAI
jgi:phage repressor protein C with HTH and peptisase S24 domain